MIAALQRPLHIHRPTHKPPGRQCSTVSAFCGTSAAVSNRTQSSFRNARRKDTGPSCRTNRCHPTILSSHLNIRQLHSDRSKSLMNQPTCAVASIHRSSAMISSSSNMMCHQGTHDDIHRFLRPIRQSIAGHPSDSEPLRRRLRCCMRRIRIHVDRCLCVLRKLNHEEATIRRQPTFPLEAMLQACQ